VPEAIVFAWLSVITTDPSEPTVTVPLSSDAVPLSRLLGPIFAFTFLLKIAL
jgi:hypothetical protein